MKVSIKEIKVEDDGTEILYIAHVGFILKSETFSGPLKRCLEKGKGKEKGKEQEIDVEALAPILAQIVSQFMSAQQQAQAREGAPQDQSKEPAEDKKTVPPE
jgi:hypothetical protein